ncbi:MAG: nitrilase-related carbon-nitrogen hydrolase [Limisphaerales bacterium]
MLWLVLAVLCFECAYWPLKIPTAGLLIVGYAYSLVRLTDQPTVRRAFYFGLVTGFLCAAPQLFFFWNVFGPAAIVLWIVFGFWLGLFVAIVCGCFRRWGKARTMWLIPIVWTGCEYFRSELYYLKFSWLNAGYAMPNFPWAPVDTLGMYGIGFLVFLAVAFFFARPIKQAAVGVAILLAVTILASLFFAFLRAAESERPESPTVAVAGVQMEFPPAGVLPSALDAALKKSPNTEIFVLSEYTLDGPPPEILSNWCRKNSRYLVVGGRDYVTNHIYYNTAFVLNTNGDIVFKQAKSVPVQLFADGLPARTQAVWNSPFGKIGICICYDLSYTRVTDELIRQGAQLLIVPTMDVSEWGRHEHELHSRVAPVRAAEYGVPIFRLTSSGISQAVDGGGKVVAQTRFDNPGEIMSATLRLPRRGSLPWDRYGAPVCTGITGLVLAALLWLTWKDHRAIQPPPTTKSS